jgi:uncharacterized protein YbdZ (MbtH family)
VVERRKTQQGETKMNDATTTTAQIICNQDPPYPIWDVYIPDGPDYWKKVTVENTREMARRYCDDHNYTIIVDW